MALGFVQSKPKDNSAGTSHSVTLDPAATAGNLLVAGVPVSGTTPLVVTPPSGFDLVPGFPVVDSGANGLLYCYYKIAAGGETLLTWTLDSSRNAALEVVEASGTVATQADVLDADSVGTIDLAAGTSSTTGGTGTLAQADEFLFAAVELPGTNGGGEAVDSTFVLLDDITHSRSLFAYKIVASTVGEDPTFSWTTSRNPTAGIVGFKAASAGTTVNLGLASEADSVQAVAAAKTATLGQPSETDTAQPVTLSKAATLGQTAETDTAFGVAATKAAILGQTFESDTTFAIAVAKTVTLGFAVETNTALGVAVSKASMLGQALETDSASALVITSDAGPDLNPLTPVFVESGATVDFQETAMPVFVESGATVDFQETA